MTRKAYIGVSDKARNIKNIYIGISDKARKVNRAYIGVNGVARLFFESDWWTAGGISSANCLAAYQFKGASSETVARTDLSGHGHTLTKWSSTSGKLAPSWSKANGFYIGATADDYAYSPTLYNDALNKKSIKSVVLRYEGFNYSLDGHSIIRAHGSDGYAALWIDGGPASQNYPGTSSGRTDNPVIVKSSNQILWANAKANASGTIGFNTKSAIYKNGVAMTLTTITETSYFSLSPPAGSDPNEYTIWLPRIANFKLYAAAFYSVALTAAQHKAVSDAMLEL